MNKRGDSLRGGEGGCLLSRAKGHGGRRFFPPSFFSRFFSRARARGAKGTDENAFFPLLPLFQVRALGLLE